MGGKSNFNDREMIESVKTVLKCFVGKRSHKEIDNIIDKNVKFKWMFERVDQKRSEIIETEGVWEWKLMAKMIQKQARNLDVNFDDFMVSGTNVKVYVRFFADEWYCDSIKGELKSSNYCMFKYFFDEKGKICLFETVPQNYLIFFGTNFYYKCLQDIFKNIMFGDKEK